MTRNYLINIVLFSMAIILPFSGCGLFQYPQDEKPQDWLYAPSSGDLQLGMAMTDVRSSWGSPRAVKVAGEDGEGNQKWLYQGGATSQIGSSESRVVYFEAGRVVGWETAP